MSPWRGPRPPVGTIGEMVEGIQQNIEEAFSRLALMKERLLTEKEQKVRDYYESEKRRCIYDVIHWREYLDYYRARVAKEGPNVVPTVWGIPSPKNPPQRKPERPAATPEEDDNGELPF